MADLERFFHGLNIADGVAVCSYTSAVGFATPSAVDSACSSTRLTAASNSAYISVDLAVFIVWSTTRRHYLREIASHF